MHVVVTAGHVDHGKSTLVRALTGMEPDRLAQERVRGLTIDLGFVWTRLPSGVEVGFVDVPGHVRFLNNMLAGVGAVRACLFVVAADDGWMAQSEEHLRILDLFGYERGVVALTKTDRIDDATRLRRHDELRRHLAGSFLQAAAILDVAGGGTGVARVRAALDQVLTDAPGPPDVGWPRLWIDRSFSVPGAGLVVTGTLTGGCLAVGDGVAIVPAARTGGQPRTVRIRGLQTHGCATAMARPGCRVAVNLAGMRPPEVTRGQALVEPGRWRLSDTVDVELTVLPASARGVGARGEFQVYVGSGRRGARLRILGDGDVIRPGGTGQVRLYFDAALPLVPGDRFVLRAPDRGETVGGGEVLDVAPVLPPGRARPDRSVDRVVAERGWVDVVELERLTGIRRVANVGKQWVVDARLLAATRVALVELVAAAGDDGLPLAALDWRQRALARATDGLVVDGERVWSMTNTRDRVDDGRRLVAALEGWGVSVPEAARLSVHPLVVRHLERHGSVVRCGEFVFARRTTETAETVARELVTSAAKGFSVAEFRSAMGCTRRTALALLGYLDGVGITHRIGDVRVAGRAALAGAMGVGGR